MVFLEMVAGGIIIILLMIFTGKRLSEGNRGNPAFRFLRKHPIFWDLRRGKMTSGRCLGDRAIKPIDSQYSTIVYRTGFLGSKKSDPCLNSQIIQRYPPETDCNEGIVLILPEDNSMFNDAYMREILSQGRQINNLTSEVTYLTNLIKEGTSPTLAKDNIESVQKLLNSLKRTSEDINQKQQANLVVTPDQQYRPPMRSTSG